MLPVFYGVTPSPKQIGTKTNEMKTVSLHNNAKFITSYSVTFTPITNPDNTLSNLKKLLYVCCVFAYNPNRSSIKEETIFSVYVLVRYVLLHSVHSTLTVSLDNSIIADNICGT